jgi:hypothetical protein
VWFRKAPRHRQGELQSIPTYFHPLDLVGSWNRVYGRQGFLQYQFVVPYEAEPVMRRVIETISGRACRSSSWCSSGSVRQPGAAQLPDEPDGSSPSTSGARRGWR